MAEVAPEGPIERSFDEIEMTRSSLESALDRIDRGAVCCVPPAELAALREAVIFRLESLGEGPPSGLQEKEAKQDGLVTLPESDRGRRGNALEVNFSCKTAQILERYFTREEWAKGHRASVAILAILIEHSDKNGDVFLPTHEIARQTGYSISTIKTEIGVLRNMRGFGVEKKKGFRKYRLSSFPVC